VAFRDEVESVPPLLGLSALEFLAGDMAPDLETTPPVSPDRPKDDEPENDTAPPNRPEPEPTWAEEREGDTDCAGGEEAREPTPMLDFRSVSLSLTRLTPPLRSTVVENFKLLLKPKLPPPGVLGELGTGSDPGM